MITLFNNTAVLKNYAGGAVVLPASGSVAVANNNVGPLILDANFRTDTMFQFTDVSDGVDRQGGQNAFEFLRTYIALAKLNNEANFGGLPHLFGSAPWNVSQVFAVAQAATILYTPAVGNRIVVQEVNINASGATDATVDVFVGTNVAAKQIVHAAYDVSNNGPLYTSRQMLFQNSAATESLRITTSAGITLSVTASGYEIPV
jgi:hypothetical protein